jgi:hypothetical protein
VEDVLGLCVADSQGSAKYVATNSEPFQGTLYRKEDVMAISISPTFTTDKLENPRVDDIIDVHDDRIRNWLLNPAATLLGQKHGSPAALCILLTYFEGAWSYKVATSSKGRSKEFFRLGFADVFKSSGVPEQVLLRIGDLLYVDARCGFFHDGMFRERVYFAEMNKDLVITLPKKAGKLDLMGDIQSVLIDVGRCYDAVTRHFNANVAFLRNTDNWMERNAFFAFFKSQCDWESPGPIIGMPEPADH